MAAVSSTLDQRVTMLVSVPSSCSYGIILRRPAGEFPHGQDIAFRSQQRRQLEYLQDLDARRTGTQGILNKYADASFVGRGDGRLNGDIKRLPLERLERSVLAGGIDVYRERLR